MFGLALLPKRIRGFVSIGGDEVASGHARKLTILARTELKSQLDKKTPPEGESPVAQNKGGFSV